MEKEDALAAQSLEFQVVPASFSAPDDAKSAGVLGDRAPSVGVVPLPEFRVVLVQRVLSPSHP